VIFLDDGGVMNDNRLRGPQWQRLLGEFLPPILGGTPEGWAEANRAVAEALWQPETLEHRFGHTDLSFAEYERYYALEWTQGSCRYLGLPEPDEDFCLELIRRVSAYVTPKVRSAFPGAVEAIRELKAQGYTLHTASGEASYDLEGYLSGMEVRECFVGLYGPDLVDRIKESPQYHARVLQHTGLEPEEALFVDDSARHLDRAAALGARTLLVGPEPHPRHPTIPALAELPAGLAGGWINGDIWL
jgi:HAD superfamily hydrolase (TIGR01509 family)